MSRRTVRTAEKASEPAFDISSLIDICFLLLIYFIVATTIQPREADLQADFARRPIDSIDQPAIRPLLVRISEDDSIHVGLDPSEPLDADPGLRRLPMLEARLELYKDGSENAGSMPMVRIQANPGCSHQRVTDVLNAMAGVGIKAVDLVDDHGD